MMTTGAEAQIQENELIDWRITSGRIEVRVKGAWIVNHAAEIGKAIDNFLSGREIKGTKINLGALQELDTFGAWLIERLNRQVGSDRSGSQLVDVPSKFKELLDRVSQSNRDVASPMKREVFLKRWSKAAVQWLDKFSGGATSHLAMFGAIGESAVRVAINPTSFRVASFVHHLDRIAWQAIPIVLLITFLIGCIIAQQGIFHFRKFGADDYVVDLVGILILRELGVLLVMIMIAGRSGSSYTAELGSMKMREEVDALRTMGRDPIEVLVLPRVLALVCAAPILTLLGSLSALYGGGIVAWLYGGMSFAIFIDRLREAVSVTHFEVGIFKAPIMGLVVGIVAATEGMRVRGSAESLGLQTTTSVVKSIFMVIVLDGIFAVFFASINM